MKKRVFRRVLAALLAATNIAGTLAGGSSTAYAAEQLGACTFRYPREGDANYDSSSWGRPALTFMNDWATDANDKIPVQTIGLDADVWVACYCIQPGVHRPTDSKFSRFDEDFWDNYPSKYNKTISPAVIKELLGRVMHYGYQGAVSDSWMSQNASDADKLANYWATQLLVWEVIVGERDEGFEHVSPGSNSAIIKCLKKANPLYSLVMDHYDRIEASVVKHSLVPSFMDRAADDAQTVELAWDGSQYSVTLTDKNKVMDDYTFKADKSGVTVTASGNKLTISAKTALNSTVTITASKSAKRTGVITWSDSNYGPDGGNQDVVTYGASTSDQLKAYVKAEIGTGDLAIKKTSEDGVVEGISFTITGTDYSKTVKTGKNGTVEVEGLTAGTYTVKEAVDDRYEGQPEQTVTVKAGATATVDFENTLRKGDLEVTKTSEDGLVKGIKFRLYGTSTAGTKVDETATTNASGVATFKDIPIGTGYTLEEVDTKDWYIVPDKQKAAIEWNKVTQKRVDNGLKKGGLEVTKTSEDGLVKGVKFRLSGTSDSGAKVDETATTNASGVATFKDIPIGTGYTLEEVDTKDWYIVPEKQKAAIEWNKVTKKDVNNGLKRGDLEVTKTSEDGLVKGMKFHLTGTADCGEKVDEYATTNSKGIATFKDMWNKM